MEGRGFTWGGADVWEVLIYRGADMLGSVYDFSEEPIHLSFHC